MAACAWVEAQVHGKTCLKASLSAPADRLGYATNCLDAGQAGFFRRVDTEMSSMKYTRFLLLACVSILLSNAALARDDIQSFPIADVLNNPEYAKRLEGVAFYFGEQAHPPITTNFGEFQSNKKTNASNKSDKEACEWAFLSALVSFRDRALSEGGNAVIRIRGYYKKNAFSSETEFQCGAGALMAGVTLKGEVVKLN
jgi:hypothetical protein